MKKKVFGKKLSRGRGARKALFRSLIRALVSFGTITTTYAKAKAVQGEIEKLVTLAKKGRISDIRRAYSILGNDRQTTNLIVNKVGKSFLTRNSGFTRIVKLMPRKGDGALMARFEWTDKIGIGTKGLNEKSQRSKSKKSEKGNEAKSKKVGAKKTKS